MSIATKTGDKGHTSLVGGSRVSKGDMRVEAYGTLDELGSAMGFARSICRHEKVAEAAKQIQITGHFDRISVHNAVGVGVACDSCFQLGRASLVPLLNIIYDSPQLPKLLPGIRAREVANRVNKKYGLIR